MAYPEFFRRKVLKYREEHGLTIIETAAHFKIGDASIVRWLKKPAPSKTRNKPPVKIPNEVLRQDVEKYPDAFQYERAARLGVSESGIGRALSRLGITRKKNSATSKSRRGSTSNVPK